MPKVTEVYKGNDKYIKASDLRGKSRNLQIAFWDVIKFAVEGKDDVEKVVLSFEGTQKALVCNKTNAGIIAANLKSEELNDWIGKQILIYPTQVNFKGEQVDAIRVKEIAPEVEADGGDIPF